MTVGRSCSRCEGTSSRAALFCQWCGAQLRDLEAFEATPQERRDGVETMADRLEERGEGSA